VADRELDDLHEEQLGGKVIAARMPTPGRHAESAASARHGHLHQPSG
jgi:hypothetical protein